MERLDAAVIGGGITGLACGFRLEEESGRLGRGLNWRLFEAGDRVGGTIRTERRGEFLMEGGPDAFLNEKPEALELIRRLGLESRLVSVSARALQRSFVLRGGKLHPVPEGMWLIAPTRFWPFWQSPLFSLHGKLRTGLEMFIPPRAEGPDESAAAFIRRRFGDELYRKVGEPMVSGIYGGDPEDLSARAVLAKFCALESRYGGVISGLREEARGRETAPASGPRYSLFLSLDQGMETLTEALRVRLEARIELGSKLESIDRAAPGAPRVLRFAGGREPVEAREVCLALPVPVAARLLAPGAPALASVLGEIRAASVLTANYAFGRSRITHPLDGFGFVAPRSEALSLIGCSFSSVKFEGRAPAGGVLLRVFAGFAAGGDEEIARRLLGELGPLLGIRGEPLFYTVSRHPESMPQYRVGHAELVERIRAEEEKTGGVTVVGNAFEGVGLSDCIRGGETAAAVILRRFAPKDLARDSSAASRPQNGFLIARRGDD